MDALIQAQVIQRYKELYGMEQKGSYLTNGTCPNCHFKDSLYTDAGQLYVIKCYRVNNCGWEACVIKLDEFSDIFV